jgi:phospholipid/cholesterol/gamma-HCH transport system ATP-binding protein
MSQAAQDPPLGGSADAPLRQGAPATEVVIDVSHVSTVLGRVVIHRDISLQVHADEVMAIIGGSGSGKTTLLRLMLGLEQPTSGEVRVFGRALGDCDPTEFDRVRHRWGVLFQQGALFSSLTVFENVALPLRELKTLPKPLITELVMQKLQQVGLAANDAIKLPAELSGGMIKRAALARALILDPQLLFLDEPTAGLDPASSKQFVQLIEAMRSEMKLTVVMVTHDVDTLFALVDRVAVLGEKRLLACGTLAEVVREEHPFIRNFFLGQTARCQEDYIRDYRQTLSTASLLEQEA